jgi:alpha-beta hydrolase superfamily lysophospholipase
VRSEPFQLRAADGVELFVNHFAPDPGTTVRGAVQLLHGMGEHGARYERLASELCGRGLALFAADCRGHGKTAVSEDDLGHFADRDGWEKVVADVRALGENIAARHSGVPRVLVGHSMGSFIALDYLTRFGDTVAAGVLSGSAPSAGALGWVFRALANAERVRLGVRGRSALLRQLLFGRFNAAFEPSRTAFDWLSRDEDEVAKYVADPLCGFVLTAGSFADFAAGLARFQRREVLSRIPHALPLYLFAGEVDPVGGRVGVDRLAEELRAAGLERVDVRIYPGGRHEMLNEVNREEVTRDLCAWIETASRL